MPTDAATGAGGGLRAPWLAVAVGVFLPALLPAVAAETGLGSGFGAMFGEGIDFRGGMLDWEEDDAGRRVAILRNYAVIILPQVTISARNMVLNVELQEVYAEGDVVFKEPNGNSFRCDQLTFNYQEWNGLAKNISVTMDVSRADLPVRDFLDDAPSLSINQPSSLNDASLSGSIRRMYVQAEELRAHDQDTFELIDAQITPDSFARPHWHFRAPAALLRRDEKIESYNNTVVIGRMPVFYVPYLIRDLQYDWPWMRFQAGYSSDLGVFARTQWAWDLRSNPGSYIKMDRVIFDADLFARRGMGIGIENTYKVGDWESLGKLKIYGVYEFLTSRNHDRDRAFGDNETKIYQDLVDALDNPIPFRPDYYRRDFRWAVDWEHYQQLNDLWDVRAEAHLYHDRDYLREYDPVRYWNEKEPENSIALRRLDKQWELEFVAQSRLSNKWIAGPEYYPEIRATAPSWQIGDLPLFFKDDFRLGFVNYAFDEDRVRYARGRNDGLFALDPATGLSDSRLWKSDHYGAYFRAFNEARLEAPLQLGGLATLKPWAGLRTAYYEDTLGRGVGPTALSGYDLDMYNAGVFTPAGQRSKGGGDVNYAVPAGVDLSSRFYTVFGASEEWRLVTEPVLSYLENFTPHLDSNDELYLVDDYDGYDRQRRFGLQLHGKLQRRFFEDAPGVRVPYRDIVDYNLRFYSYPRGSDRDDLNRGRSVSDVEFELGYHPMRNLDLRASLLYDADSDSLKRGIFQADWRFGDIFRVIATHYHYSGDYWPFSEERFDKSDQTNIAIRTKLWNDSSHYALEVAANYEWRDSNEWRNSLTGVRHGFNRYRVTLFRDIDTFEMALSYIRDRNKDDHGVYFSLAPKSFMGIERPPPSYTGEVEALGSARYSDAEYFAAGEADIDVPVVDADLKDVGF